MILNSVRLKKIKKHMNSILKDNLDRLKDPSIHEYFQATVAGIFEALFMVHDEILREKKKPDNSTMGHDKILDLCDQGRDVKKAKNTTNGAEV